ncbi:MAG TPA: 2-oxoacid:acceptor oxidoreductase subunit alpha [Xanthobacteraceae bacterium]|nr:2-oxoacid:acceptor oxidoreductase subunit alpha [Xanthobacteraceae bacterium]
MPRASLSVVFAGSGGSGAMTAGMLFLRAAARAGYYGMMTQLFGPQVRGGEAAALVQVAARPTDSPPDRYDLFVALDWEKLDQFAPEIPLDQASAVIADPASGTMSPGIAKANARLVPLAMADPATSGHHGKAEHVRRTNVFAAAAICALAGVAADHVRAALADILGTKLPEVMRANAASLEAGLEAARALELDVALAPPAKSARWLISGNEAVALGALRGGVRFVGCYPITPATDLVEWLAPQLLKLGGRLVLAEDELASINMVVGASFGGTPSMTVTSGPGLSLMVETLGLAVAAEIPLVVVDVMRAGPSTGIPSKTEQSDVNIAVHGGHGDAPRVVLAPTSVADCLPTAEWAVYLAESLQTPVIVLSDQAMGQAQAAIDLPLERPQPLKRRLNGAPSGALFKRYAIGDDPVTPMPPPGTAGYQWVGEGLTHNEAGIPVSGASAHAAQIRKRARKLDQLKSGSWWGETFGEGDIAIVTFGSGVGAAREAARRLAAGGRPARMIALRQIAPVPLAELRRALAGAKQVFVLEQNHGAQLFHHLLGQRAIAVDAHSIARPGPLPFRPAEIVAHVA